MEWQQLVGAGNRVDDKYMHRVSGSDVYAGGWLKNAGGVAANRIASGTAAVGRLWAMALALARMAPWMRLR